MLDIAINISFILLGLALLLTFLRLVLGPTVPDRVVALELLVSLTVGIIGVYTVVVDVANFLDVAIVLALTAFLAAVAFARHIEKGVREDD